MFYIKTLFYAPWSPFFCAKFCFYPSLSLKPLHHNHHIWQHHFVPQMTNLIFKMDLFVQKTSVIKLLKKEAFWNIHPKIWKLKNIFLSFSILLFYFFLLIYFSTPPPLSSLLPEPPSLFPFSLWLSLSCPYPLPSTSILLDCSNLFVDSASAYLGEWLGGGAPPCLASTVGFGYPPSPSPPPQREGWLCWRLRHLSW